MLVPLEYVVPALLSLDVAHQTVPGAQTKVRGSVLYFWLFTGSITAAVPVTLCVFVLLRTSSVGLFAGVHPVDSCKVHGLHLYFPFEHILYSGELNIVPMRLGYCTIVVRVHCNSRILSWLLILSVAKVNVISALLFLLEPRSVLNATKRCDSRPMSCFYSRALVYGGAQYMRRYFIPAGADGIACPDLSVGQYCRRGSAGAHSRTCASLPRAAPCSYAPCSYNVVPHSRANTAFTDVCPAFFFLSWQHKMRRLDLTEVPLLRRLQLQHRTGVPAAARYPRHVLLDLEKCLPASPRFVRKTRQVCTSCKVCHFQVRHLIFCTCELGCHLKYWNWVTRSGYLVSLRGSCCRVE